MSRSKLCPVAFMVMPFRKRPIPDAPAGAPKEIDFDALWDRAFRPALEQLGYLAIRADMEAGTVIVKDMLERLAFADLVLADLTLPNGNVYYEVGIRHVAKQTNCVLISADWSKQLFDVDQFRSLRYPLKDGRVSGPTATAIKARLIKQLCKVKDSKTPYYELVTSKKASSAFREHLETISEFQAALRAARMMPSQEERGKRVAEIVKSYTGSSLEIPEVAFELMMIVRDNLSWEEMVGFCQKLPKTLQLHPFTKEQTLLAQSMLGNHEDAIAGLKMLIEMQGDSAERRGLIGGRYKRLWRAARDVRIKQMKKKPSVQESAYLDNAIENYDRGAKLDLNEYYCVCNLPGLLRDRNAKGDREQAAILDRLTLLAAERKIYRGEDDGWARSTLLGTSFRIADVEKVESLTKEVIKEGPAAWQLKSTLADITDTLNAMAPSATTRRLKACAKQLADLLIC